MLSMTRKRAQSSSSSAIFLIILTVLMVLYILFLPPADRAELLGVGSGGGGVSGVPTTNHPPQFQTYDLLEEHIGHLEHRNNDERVHSIPSFRISTSSEGSSVKNTDSLYVRSSAFETFIENVTFRLDTQLTSDVKLSFNVGNVADGRLIVLLNGYQIINEDLAPQTNKFISLPRDLLQTYNTLTFGVSAPGWAFWRNNEYQLSSLQITGNIKDISGSESEQVFFLSDEEIDNLERATLKFFADCVPSNVGRLTIEVNSRLLFSSIPDCNAPTTLEFDETYLFRGENDITFKSEDGSYLITSLQVKTQLREPVYPLYYFDMDDAFFSNVIEDEEVCGKVDGICPVGCHEDLDKDCCFNDRNNFWCDIETQQLNDRCVSFVTETTCARCSAGYEDHRGDPAESCEMQCGDDTDDECPVGCSAFLDKDCCFASGENYWCDDVPFARPLSSVCKLGVEPDERNACPDKYYNEDRQRLAHVREDIYEQPDEELKSVYKVLLTLTFPNNDVKRAEILVNGQPFGLEAATLEREYDISNEVRSGTNSIEIVPRSSMDITSMNVRIEQSFRR